MVFQRPVMLRRSALANVVYALKLAGVRRRERERCALEALEEVGLAHLAHRPARVLSGGEQQRLALARAWALHPEVLFLDEPTANLDPGATREIETVIKAFDAAGTKIVMSTHNLGQARRLGDEVLFLHQGRARRARAGRALFRAARLARSGGVHQRRTAMGLIASILAGACLLRALPAHAQQRFITVASTTSTEQSGLFKHLLPIFEKKTGIQVRVVALGTGQALDMGTARRRRRGVRARQGRSRRSSSPRASACDRHEVMYNDFVLVGPKSDPAKVAGGKDVVAGAAEDPGRARRRSPRAATSSGTHFAELELWKAAGIDIAQDKGAWYRETGSGMGPTLNTASGMNAYALTDRGTWLSFKNRGELAIAGGRRPAPLQPVRRDPRESGEASAREEGSGAGVHRLGHLAAKGQKAIADYKIGGEQLFFPNARK